MKSLRHENIVQIIDCFSNENEAHIIMELMECSLQDYIKEQGGKLDERQSAQIMYMLAKAMNYMHDIGYVHFDLKPANVMLKFERPKNGDSSQINLDTRSISDVKISDFGISMERQTKYFSTTHCMGSLPFMAPE